MSRWCGIDVGSTYTKAVILGEDGEVFGRSMRPTGFRLAEAAEQTRDEALAEAGVNADDLVYVVATGYGRHMCAFKDLAVTDLTAAARGARLLFPDTRTVLDIGGQTMKASRVDETSKVKSFRLNDKCAAGTGAFLEKTARYMNFETDQIGALAASAGGGVEISGVCAVFAESEVINQLSIGASPADIMHGAMVSLVGRSMQLMRRVRMEPSFTLVGGIMRFPTMVDALESQLEGTVNVAEGDFTQFVGALGAAELARLRSRRLATAA